MDIYFNKFPLIYYIVDINGVPTTKVVRDITTNVRIRRSVLENVLLFDEYVMDNNETPEIVAYKYYGSTLLHWVVLLCNQRYNSVTDFPMSQDVFLEYLDDKYQRVPVPTFPTSEGRASYIQLLETDISEPLLDKPVYSGQSSDAVKWIANTKYDSNVLLRNNNNYYLTLNTGTSDDYCVVLSNNSEDIRFWEADTYYVQGMVLVHKNEYYLVKKSGTSDSEGPSHIEGEAYNGTTILRADILFFQAQTVIDIDPNLQWAIFPTDNEANEYIDNYYTAYGDRVGASSMIHHLHHYEDEDGNIINFLNPEPNYYPAPIILSDQLERLGEAQEWLTETYYSVGTLVKVSEDRYYRVLVSGFSDSTNPPTETIGEVIDGSLVLDYFPLYTAITNYVYEERINEQKRHLKLIHKSTLDQILNQLKDLTS